MKGWVDPDPSPDFVLFKVEESPVAVFEDSGQVAPEVKGAGFWRVEEHVDRPYDTEKTRGH